MHTRTVKNVQDTLPGKKTQQDSYKYWNSSVPKSAYKEKDQPISSDTSNDKRKKAIVNEKSQKEINKETDQPVSSDSEQTNTPKDKKRKAPVYEKGQEETVSPPLKRMHETTEIRDEFHRSLSSSNLQNGAPNHNHNPNMNLNPLWMVEMERHLENNLTMNLIQNLKSIIDESVSKAIEKVTASVNKIIEANPVIQTHGTAISELKKDSATIQVSVNKLNREQEELKAKLISIENRTLENCGDQRTA